MVFSNIRLREAREAKNWSQQDLTEKMNVGPGSVGRWERGETFPSAYNRRKLCELFQLDADGLGLKKESYNKADIQEETEIAPSDEIVPSNSTSLQMEPNLTEILPSDGTTQGKRRVSRRTVAVGLAGLITLGATGDLLWLKRPVPPTVRMPIYTYRGHSDIVYRVRWSPNGTRIVSASADATAQVWEAATGKNLLIYHGHTNAVEAAVWSPDGTHIASGSHDTTVRVWEAATGKDLLIYHGHKAPVYTVAWSPDRTRIATGDSSGTVQVWSAAQGSLLCVYRHKDAAKKSRTEHSQHRLFAQAKGSSSILNLS